MANEPAQASAIGSPEYRRKNPADHLAVHRFRPGNSGRPVGIRNRWIALIESSCDIAAIISAMESAAIDGDVSAAKLLLDRAAPAPSRPKVVVPDAPEVTDHLSAVEALSSIATAALTGKLEPDAALILTNIITKRIEVEGQAVIQQRLAALEEAVGKRPAQDSARGSNGRGYVPAGWIHPDERTQ